MGGLRSSHSGIPGRRGSGDGNPGGRVPAPLHLATAFSGGGGGRGPVQFLPSRAPTRTRPLATYSRSSAPPTPREHTSGPPSTLAPHFPEVTSGTPRAKSRGQPGAAPTVSGYSAGPRAGGRRPPPANPELQAARPGPHAGLGPTPLPHPRPPPRPAPAPEQRRASPGPLQMASTSHFAHANPALSVPAAARPPPPASEARERRGEPDALPVPPAPPPAARPLKPRLPPPAPPAASPSASPPQRALYL